MFSTKNDINICRQACTTHPSYAVHAHTPLSLCVLYSLCTSVRSTRAHPDDAADDVYFDAPVGRSVVRWVGLLCSAAPRFGAAAAPGSHGRERVVARTQWNHIFRERNSYWCVFLLGTAQRVQHHVKIMTALGKLK